MRPLVVMPIVKGQIHRESMDSMYNLEWDEQLDFLLLIGGDDPKTPNENVVKKYNAARDIVLQNGYDALLTIESDIIAPRDALKRLGAIDADVAYAVYVWRHGFPWWNAYPVVRADRGETLSSTPELAREKWGQVIEVEGVGNGCTLIHRRVLEALEFKWKAGEFGCCDWHLSLDCQRLGFVQKCDLGLVCGHISVDPVHRIVWPDGEARGLYRMELLANWEPLPKDDKWLAGVEGEGGTPGSWASEKEEA